MTRKKIRHEQLQNRNKRNTIYRNRLDGLLKKANELSILCGVETAIVVHTQERKNDVQWPTPEIFRERLDKFLNFPDTERCRKMVIHDTYLEQRVSDERKNIIKLQKKNELKEFHQLMSELVKGKCNMDNLDLYQLNVLQSHSAEFLKKLQKREDELNNDAHMSLLEPRPSAVASGTDKMSTEILLENMKRDAWFFETMSEGQDGEFVGFPPTSDVATNFNGGDVTKQI